MKSLLCNVFFPAWVWTKTPSAKFLCFSFSEALTLRDSMKCRELIASRWYEERFHIVINKRQDSKENFQNTYGGYRVCFGTGGSITGQGGDYLIIDDPLDATKANSKAERERVNYTYDNSIHMRGNDPKTVKKILIMQRLHDEDLCGHIIERGDPWELLILPAEWEGVERFHSSIGFTDPRTEVNELLWEAHIGRKELDILKLPLSEIGVAGQFQQRPTPLVGAIFKREWFNIRRASLPCVGRYFSWDTAASIEDTAAYTCGIVGSYPPITSYTSVTFGAKNRVPTVAICNRRTGEEIRRHEIRRDAGYNHRKQIIRYSGDSVHETDFTLCRARHALHPER
jgi:hypothetical protein